jgi:hypothetical protein
MSRARIQNLSGENRRAQISDGAFCYAASLETGWDSIFEWNARPLRVD